MCKYCWNEAGAPTELPENAADLIADFEAFYSLPKCGAGGPLHVELDDMNAGTEWMPRVYPGVTYTEEVMVKAQQIADRMNLLPISQRYAVLAKWEGYF